MQEAQSQRNLQPYEEDIRVAGRGVVVDSGAGIKIGCRLEIAGYKHNAEGVDTDSPTQVK